ncbi:transposase [Knoellia aerolata]|uniref:transposase n=1 Tax=Knoellia aerolata TaxID=442954 RepID=UPI000A03F893
MAQSGRGLPRRDPLPRVVARRWPRYRWKLLVSGRQTGRRRTGGRPGTDPHPQEGRGQGAQDPRRRDRTSLLGLHGIGPSGAARLLVEVGDLSRFPDRNHFASAPAPPRSTPPPRTTCAHRLSRGGNRQIDRLLHIMATVQLRTPPPKAVTTSTGRGRQQDLDGSHALPQTTPV